MSTKTSRKLINILTIVTTIILILLSIYWYRLGIFTSQEKLMGEFKNHFLVTIIAWAVTIILTILNIYLIITTFI